MPIVAGVDLARMGEDRSVFFAYSVEGKRYRPIHLEVWCQMETMESAGKIGHLINKNNPIRTVIDADGIGAPVFDRLREMGFNMIPFHGMSRTDRRDETGELGFFNLRSYAWWHVRSLLSLENGIDIKIPQYGRFDGETKKNDDIVGDLCAPRWKTNSNGLIQVESKEDVKKRLGRSPDLGDALCYCLCDVYSGEYESNYNVYDQRSISGASKQGSPVILEDVPTPGQKIIESLLWKDVKSNTDIFSW